MTPSWRQQTLVAVRLQHAAGMEKEEQESEMDGRAR